MCNIGSKIRDYCGVFGIVSKDFSYSVAGLIYSGLMALQHRGQLYSGISISSCEGPIDTYKGKGLVSKVLSPKTLRNFIGNVGIGHVCYGTPYCSNEENAQPYLYKSNKIEFSIALNGRITNPTEIQIKLEKMGRVLTGISDIELLASLIAAFYDLTNQIFDALKEIMKVIRGAYCIVVLTKKGDIFAIRDSIGYKPLCFGSLEREDKHFYVFASESCALDVIGAKVIDDVKPGEIVYVNPTESLKREQIIPHLKHGICSYEYIYFARPDSVIDGISVGKVRYNLGINLAIGDDVPSENTIVVPVPDSGRSAAMGYSWKSKITYAEGLMKNRYLWQLKKDFNEKLNPIKAITYDKDIVLVDDSIVSGVTMKKIIKMLRNAGSKLIHVRISCPPLIKNCDLNDSLSNRDIFIALEAKIKNFDNFNEEMRKYIGADSLKYQSMNGLIDAIGKSEDTICSICLKEICDLDEEIIRNKIEIV